MRRKVLSAVGVAVLLILGVWVWQSGLDSKPRSEKVVTAADANAESSTETALQTSHSPTPSGPEENREDQNQSGSVSGTVRLKATGAPVARAVVQARNRKGEEPFESALVYTDEQGSYTLTGLPVSRVLRFAVTPPILDLYVAIQDIRGSSFKPGETEKTGVNILLSEGRAGTIAGRVVGRTHTFQTPDDPTSATSWLENYERKNDIALAGVQISVVGYSGECEATAVTDQAGRFRIENIRPGPYGVRAATPKGAAFFPEGEKSITITFVDLPGRSRQSEKWPDPEKLEFCFRMDGVSIEGNVRDPQGNPIAGAEITALYQHERNDSGYPQTETTKMATTLSNTQGQFRLDNLAAFDLGDALYYVKEGKSVNNFQLECAAQGYCAIKTLLPPYPVGLIEAAMVQEENLLKLLPAERTKDSKFADVKYPDGEGNSITGVDLILSPVGSISGRVVDREGNPIQSLVEQREAPTRIALVVEEELLQKKIVSPSDRPVRIPKPVELDGNSCFKFEGVPPGRYFFNVGMTHLSVLTEVRAINEVLVFQEGETVQDFNIVVETIRERGDVVGHVVDALTGEPVDELTIEFFQQDNTSDGNRRKGWGFTRQLQGDQVINECDLPVGDFTINSLTAGEFMLKISAPGYEPIQPEMEVVAGQTTEQTFRLGEGAGLRGRVVDAETKEPVENFSVRITHAEGEKKGEAIEGKVRKDKERKGEFSLTGIPAGLLSVEVTEGSENSYGSSIPGSGYGVGGVSESSGRLSGAEEVEIVIGSITERTFPLYRRGFLTGRIEVNGVPSRSAYLSVKKSESAPPEMLMIQNIEDGYKSYGLEKGDYRVLAQITQYTCGFQEGTRIRFYERAHVTIKAGKETRQDFKLQGNGTIRGSFKAPNRDFSWSILLLEGSVTTCDSMDPFENVKICATAEDLQKGDRYEIRYLAPGTYTLFARYPSQLSGESPMTEKSQTVTLTEGQALTVDFEFP